MGGKDSMFRYADGMDKLLMFFGVLGSVGEGLRHPLTMYILSHVINDYGSSGISLSTDTVNKVSNLTVMHCTSRNALNDMSINFLLIPLVSILSSSCILQLLLDLLHLLVSSFLVTPSNYFQTSFLLKD